MIDVIRPTPTEAINYIEYVYDYFIKDYTSTTLCASLGNVRVVLTEEDATTETKFLATLEEAYRQMEISNFDNIEETVENIPIEYPINGSVELNEKIAMLSAANGTEIGPSIVLPVKRGDKVSLRTDYFYSQDDQAETYDNFGLLVNEVLLALASSGAGVLQLSEAQLLDIATGSGNYGQAVSDFMSSNFDTTDVTKPHAYLIWVLYDNTMRLVPEGSGVLRVTDPNALERLLQDEIPIVGDGYLHAYVANHSSRPSLFDNIMVTLLRGKTRQINHYYPYGLSISGIGGDYDEYLNKYTGKELQTGEFDPAVSTGLEMFDFHARFYDPQIGRWFTPDPAEQFHNPYLAMANNPVRYTDPDGRHSQPILYWNDEGNSTTGAGGGSPQQQSQMWTNLIYASGAPSNNHWGNVYGLNNGGHYFHTGRDDRAKFNGSTWGYYRNFAAITGDFENIEEKDMDGNIIFISRNTPIVDIRSVWVALSVQGVSQNTPGGVWDSWGEGSVPYQGKMIAGTNFIGKGPPGDPRLSKLTYVDEIDAASYFHDIVYYKNRASGFGDVRFNTDLAFADLQLVNAATSILDRFQERDIDSITGYQISERTYNIAWAVYLFYGPIVIDKYNRLGTKPMLDHPFR